MKKSQFKNYLTNLNSTQTFFFFFGRQNNKLTGLQEILKSTLKKSYLVGCIGVWNKGEKKSWISLLNFIWLTVRNDIVEGEKTPFSFLKLPRSSLTPQLNQPLMRRPICWYWMKTMLHFKLFGNLSIWSLIKYGNDTS